MPGCDAPRPETASSDHPATTEAKHKPAKPATRGANHARQQKPDLSALADRNPATKFGEKGGLDRFDGMPRIGAASAALLLSLIRQAALSSDRMHVRLRSDCVMRLDT